MKKALSLLLAVLMVASLLVPVALADNEAGNELAVVYTGNLNGDLDAYARAAAVREYYQNSGYTAILVDVGNYMQGSAAANADRGQTVFRLMDAAGYTAAAMGEREFYYGDATTGMKWHGNYHKYYTQAELLRGAAEETYGTNGSGSVTATRAALAPATFSVLASNIVRTDDATGYYDFDSVKTVAAGSRTVGIYALSDPNVADRLQDGFTEGYDFGKASDANAAALASLKGSADISVCLNASGAEVSGATLTLSLPESGARMLGVKIINCDTGAVTDGALPDAADNAGVQAIADAAKTAASESKLGVSTVTLNGADRDNWCRETNLGDLVTDALKWYAENRFDGFKKDAPVVAIQNGGNCDQFIYPGDVTTTDLLCALPFSPMGVSIVYVTVDELAMILEAGTSPSAKYGELLCPGFAQVSGVEYEVHRYKEYLAGEAVGNYYKPLETSRVVITGINGRSASELKGDDMVAVIADNFIVNGGDTYYLLKEIAERADGRRINNGTGVLTRDIVAMYIEKVLGGTVGSAYAQPQGRIVIKDAPDPVELPFVDVQDGAYYYSALRWAYGNEITTGIDSTHFAPDASCTRAQVVTFLWRAANCPEPSSLSTPFTDLQPGSFYEKAAAWAYEKGIVKGMTATSFAPDATVTRAQFVTFLWRYEDSPSSTVLNQFDDVGSAEYYTTAVLWASEKGITNGMGNGLFAPTAPCTRAQVVTFLHRNFAD